MLALVTLAESLTYGRDAFIRGIQALGYQVVRTIPHPSPSDVAIVWNRRGQDAIVAHRFEQAGAKVLVAENGYMGKTWIGHKWFALARSHHNGAGTWHVGGPERWARWGVELAPWRTDGSEIVLLPQRGIGEPGVRMPDDWPRRAASFCHGKGLHYRSRQHPGAGKPDDLLDDLKNASCVFTWASGAAIRAMAAGIPVFYEFEKWIGGMGARHIRDFSEGPRRDDAARLACFERLAWAMWTLEEVQSGEAIKGLL